MRKQDGPAIAHPFMEIDGALRSFCGEIGSFVVYTQDERPSWVGSIIHTSFRCQHVGEGMDGLRVGVMMKILPSPGRISSGISAQSGEGIGCLLYCLR